MHKQSRRILIVRAMPFAAYLMIAACGGSFASAQENFDSMGYTWTTTASGFYESTASSFTLYGLEGTDQVAWTPFGVSLYDTVSYDYLLSGVGPDNIGQGTDAAVHFRNSMSDSPWPAILASPRLIYNTTTDYLDLQDTNNDFYSRIFSLTPTTTGIHVEIYFDSLTTAQLRIWNGSGPQTGEPVFSSVDGAVSFDLNGTIQSLRVGLWNSPGQFVTFSNLAVAPGSGPSLGDHNADGVVDAADYVFWRDTMSGDITGYDEWKANFGAPSGTGAVASAVPEPATWLLFTAAFVAMACTTPYCTRREM